MWFTDLLHICDNISHLQTELLTMFIVKKNHCFCCEAMCVLVIMGEEGQCEEVNGRRSMGGGKRKGRVNTYVSKLGGRNKMGILLVMSSDVNN